MYKTLERIGVTDFKNIERYTLHQQGDVDILKIYFKQKKGSLFPRNTKFRCGRSKKTVLVNGGKREYKEISEISPTLLKAEQELNQIVRHDTTKRISNRKKLDDIEKNLEMVIERKLLQFR